jgi:serine phosphatase RsbU (regulator of sigma subunit)
MSFCFRYYFFSILSIVCFCGYGQEFFIRQIDSLGKLAKLNTLPGEQNQLLINQLNYAARLKDTSIFHQLKTEAENLAKQKQHHELIAGVYQSLGILNYYKGNNTTALKFFDSSCTFAKRNNYEESLMASYMSRGAIRYLQQDYYKALNDYLASEKLMIKHKSNKLGGLYSNISMIYNNIGDYTQAEKYLRKAVPFSKTANDFEGLVKAHNNLGLIAKRRGRYEEAESTFRKALSLAKEYHFEQDISDIVYNLSEVLDHLGKNEEALANRLKLYKTSLLAEENDWRKMIAMDLAIDYFSIKNTSSVYSFLKEAKSIQWSERATPEQMIDYYTGLAKLSVKLNDSQSAAEAFSKVLELKGAQEKEASTLNLQKMNYQHQRENDSLAFVKQREIDEKEKEITEHRLVRQRILTAISICVLILIGLFSISLFRTNKQKEIANKEILKQQQLIAIKNKEITDSINYAQRIQHSLLPTKQTLKSVLPDHFLIYLPKDIVSGDFYWHKEINKEEFFIAVADCTGHGVPGAIMSALSIQQLNEISETVKEPSEILRKLNIKIKENLNQEEEGFSKDGLDITLCKINLKEMTLDYSAANRSLWIFNSEGLKQEIKATKAGIAGHTANNQEYTQHRVIIEKNDLFVMSTDGYADQFGGPKQKKITTKYFKSLIAQSLALPVDHTGLALQDAYLRWKNTSEQIDDVCVMGFKFV